MGTVWLVRHAPVLAEGVCYGQSEVPVTLSPDAAASLIAQRWSEQCGVDRPEVWSSPSDRTREVGESLARGWATKCHVDRRLSELSFGVWEGRSYRDIQQNDKERWERWIHSYDVEAPPLGETAAELRIRFVAWLEERRRSASRVLAITHAGIIRTARALACGLPYAEFSLQRVEHLRPELAAFQREAPSAAIMPRSSWFACPPGED